MTTTSPTPQFDALAYFADVCAERGWLNVPSDDTTEYESLLHATRANLGAHDDD